MQSSRHTMLLQDPGNVCFSSSEQRSIIIHIGGGQAAAAAAEEGGGGGPGLSTLFLSLSSCHSSVPGNKNKKQLLDYWQTLTGTRCCCLQVQHVQQVWIQQGDDCSQCCTWSGPDTQLSTAFGYISFVTTYELITKIKCNFTPVTLQRMFLVMNITYITCNKPLWDVY